MRNLVSLILLFSSSAFTVIPADPAVKTQAANQLAAIDYTNDNAEILYETINLQSYGLSKEAFTYAWKGFQYLRDKNRISQPGYLSICDFSQPSRKKRFYLIDVTNKKLLINTYVAHGRNSGHEYATRFSNRPGSLQSSLGFYITQGIYTGEHGLSLRICGVEAGYNDKALRRNIVVHGADYAEDGWLRRSGQLGRSYGCPAIPKSQSKEIIETIQNGSCFFIYHPTKIYLKRSKILNG